MKNKKDKTVQLTVPTKLKLASKAAAKASLLPQSGVLGGPDPTPGLIPPPKGSLSDIDPFMWGGC